MQIESLNTTEMLLIALLILVAIDIIIRVVDKSGKELITRLGELTSSMTGFGHTLDRTEKSVKDEFHRNRQESNEAAKANRDELASTLEIFRNQIDKNTKTFETMLESRLKALESQQSDFNKRTNAENRVNREELSKSFGSFEEKFGQEIKAFKNVLREQFDDFSKRQTEINQQTTEDVKEVRSTVEKQLKMIREDNEKQLVEMRQTVDEKLQKTLNARLSQSFETVGKQLQSVQEGLGEMKNLATDVGGLKKVLSNVKLRGGIGEIQLEMLLEQILAPDQYEANVKTKKSSSDVVEFAIKLPGAEDDSSTVWLPIDAKFPKDVYEQLIEAHETGDVDRVKDAHKKMETTIKKMAKDISDKYLDPPNTTDFAIMFLPFEGIYAEVTRNSGLMDSIRYDHHIAVAGPTNLAVILNGLHMGFKTLAIEKRSSEVWQVLGAVKKEFSNFGTLMNKAQKNIQTGLDQLDNVMGVRTRAIQRRLKSVETLNGPDVSKAILDIDETSTVDDAEE